MENITVCAIAHIHNDFTEKFGIPRQSGLCGGMESRIVFTPPYRVAEALRGVETYSHLWLLWHFSAVRDHVFRPTVRPPKLGGNCRVGVFATRSPYRPNPIGLSCVALAGVDWNTKDGPVLRVRGADLMNGTPILDIKPYLAYADAYPEASAGFALTETTGALRVLFPPEWLEKVPPARREGLIAALSQDPRPAYQNDPVREYAMAFGEQTVCFRVEDGTLRVVRVEGEAFSTEL